MTITDEMVERAARAAHDAEYDGDAYPWAEEPDGVKRQYRNMSRAALEAALMAAAKALEGVMTRTSGWQWPEIKTAERALAALRAAGIDLGG